MLALTYTYIRIGESKVTFMKQENITQLRTPFGFFKYVVRPHTGWFILAILFVVSASILGSGSSYIFKLIIFQPLCEFFLVFRAVRATLEMLAQKFGAMVEVA